MSLLSLRQRTALATVRRLTTLLFRPPSHRELAASLGVPVQAAFDLVMALRRHGLMTPCENRAPRSLTLTKDGEHAAWGAWPETMTPNEQATLESLGERLGEQDGAGVVRRVLATPDIGALLHAIKGANGAGSSASDRRKSIGPALNEGMIDLMALGAVRVKTSEAIDFVIERTIWHLSQGEASQVSYARSDVVEVWLHQAIGQLAEARGVRPMEGCVEDCGDDE